MLIIDKLKALDKLIDRLTGIIVICSLSLMLLIVSIQVFCRYILHSGFYWMPELARYLLVGFSFLAGSMALRRKELVGVTFVYKFFSPKLRRWIELISEMLIIFFLLVGISFGFKTAKFIIQTGQLSPGLQIPIGFFYLPIPISFLLMLITSIISIFNLMFKYSQEDTDMLTVERKKGIKK